MEICGRFDKNSKGHLSLNIGTVRNLELITIFDHETKASRPNFFLYVSNGSIELTPVNIGVTIDGAPVVQDSFDVKGKRTLQHNWMNYEFVLSPGSHLISAETRKGNATVAKEFVLDSLKFLVIDYYYPVQPETASKIKSGKFVITISDHKIGFD